MRLLVLLLALLALTGCSNSLQPLEVNEDLILVNNAEQALLYLAVGLERSHLMDPNPIWMVQEASHRLIAPGGGAPD